MSVNQPNKMSLFFIFCGERRRYRRPMMTNARNNTIMMALSQL